ncbi:MAG TPA: hypothetical protein VK714_07270 [Myxococcota bacterium]|nr:hypothetical protein [Myxococcota bacterium]
MAGQPIESAGLGLFVLRALAWAGASAALLAGGFYGLGAALVALGRPGAGTSLGEIELTALHAVFMAVLVEALLPHWILTLTTWLVLVRFAPRLDHAWRSLGPGLLAVAALWFPVAGFVFFRAWKPTSAADVAHTWLLMTAGVAAALLLPRLFPPLTLGALAGPGMRSTLKGA